jgi:hypothetical protein
VPFPFSEPEKHSILSTKFAIVGRGQVLKSNAGNTVGGFNIITRTAGAGLPGDLWDINGTAVNVFGSGNIRGSAVSACKAKFPQLSCCNRARLRGRRKAIPSLDSRASASPARSKTARSTLMP